VQPVERTTLHATFFPRGFLGAFSSFSLQGNGYSHLAVGYVVRTLLSLSYSLVSYCVVVVLIMIYTGRYNKRQLVVTGHAFLLENYFILLPRMCFFFQKSH